MKTGKTRKAQTNKTNYMSDEAFAELKQAMEDALAFERGERRDLKVTQIQVPRRQRQCRLEILRAYVKSSTALKRFLP